MGVDARMIIRTGRELTEQELNGLASEAAARFDIVYRKERGYCDDEAKGIGTPLEGGDAIECSELQRKYELDLTCRYYGPGYERGPALVIVALAEFLEVYGAHVLKTTVEPFYGGDCDDNVLRFDRAAREELKALYFAVERAPYLEFFGRDDGLIVCTFCNDRPMSHLWSGGSVGVHCRGCDQRVMKHADGTLHAVRPDRGPGLACWEIDSTRTPKARAITGERT